MIDKKYVKYLSKTAQLSLASFEKKGSKEWSFTLKDGYSLKDSKQKSATAPSVMKLMKIARNIVKDESVANEKVVKHFCNKLIRGKYQYVGKDEDLTSKLCTDQEENV